MNHYNELESPRTLDLLSLEELQTQLTMAIRSNFGEKRINYIIELITKINAIERNEENDELVASCGICGKDSHTLNDDYLCKKCAK